MIILLRNIYQPKILPTPFKESSMNRCVLLLSGLLTVYPVATFAQGAEDAIRKAENAMVAAAKAGDKAAYQRLYSDDLRWLNSDGRMLNKPQRIGEVSVNPTFN